MLATIEDYLALLELAEPDRRNHGSAEGRRQRLPLSAFKHAEPLGFGNPVPHDDDERMYFDAREENNPSRWLPRFDVRLLVGSENPGQRFTLRRWRTLTDQEKRGRIHPWTRYAVESSAAAVMDDGRYTTAHTDWGWVGGRWMLVRAQGTLWVGDNSGLPGEECDPDLWPERTNDPDGACRYTTLLAMAHQHAVYRGLLWHVALGYAAHEASLLVPCAAHAILELFRQRELPPGKKRRDALLHWVDAHGRRKASNPDEVQAVAAHLRGQTSFVWKEGLVVSVLPSEEDKKRVKDWHKHAADAVAPR